VRLDEPSWWYAAPAECIAQLLRPLGATYGWVAMARYRRSQPYRSRLPVICVGNFTAGGTGKTPLVLHLCRRLADAGEKPIALTRGYGGRLTSHWVDPGSDAARDVGDEPLLLARAAPTRIARNRASGARAIEAGPRPASVIVMDDGLQNPTLAKDLTIAVVDGMRGVGNGLVMPAGPLRAPLDFQLDLTDAIVVNEPQDAAGTVSDWLRRRFAGPVLRARVAPVDNADWLAGANLVAWAGIGAPQRFFALLERHGAVLAERIAFGDHRRLGEGDARRLLALARRHSARLVTTEKDAARLLGTAGSLAELARTSHLLHVALQPIAPDDERLLALIDATLKAPHDRPRGNRR
jgi:tetraacyldisaccharide 4'-kinase